MYKTFTEKITKFQRKIFKITQINQEIFQSPSTQNLSNVIPNKISKVQQDSWSMRHFISFKRKKLPVSVIYIICMGKKSMLYKQLKSEKKYINFEYLQEKYRRLYLCNMFYIRKNFLNRKKFNNL